MLSPLQVFAFIGGALLLTVSVFPQSLSEAGSKVVFVCEHGAAKSVMAAAYFNQLAKERGLAVRAVSSGTNPDPAVSPKVIAGLRSEGVTEITAKPRLVTEQDLSGATRVVTLGCALPYKVKATDWKDVPSPGADYPAASRVIRNHVKSLLDDLAAAERTPTTPK